MESEVIKKKKRKIKDIDFLNQRELGKFFEVLEKSKKENVFWQRDLAMFHVAYYCGLRASEVGKITLADYNSQY